MERRKLRPGELDEATAELPDWSVVDGKLSKTFKFRTFAEAMGWMVAVAVHADRIDHHPEWSNVYNRVNVSLITHDLDALSTLDLALARRMEELAASR